MYQLLMQNDPYTPFCTNGCWGGRKRDLLFLFSLIDGFPLQASFFLLDVALFAPVVIWRHGNAFVEEGTQTVALVRGCASPHAFRASSCAISNEGSSIRSPLAEIDSLCLRLLPLRLRSGLKAGSARNDKARVIVKYAGTWPCVIARNPSAMLRVNSTTRQSPSV